MHIAKITSNVLPPQEQCFSTKKRSDNLSLYRYKTAPVSFKSITTLGAGLGLHIFSNYKKLCDQQKLVKNLVKRVKNPDLSNADTVLQTLFELAQSRAKDIKGIPFFSTRNIKSDLTNVRSYALEELFPIVNDVDYGHASKTALLSDMVETGEYVASSTFYRAFKNLPPALYEDDKRFLVKKMLNDINVFKNARNNLKSKDAQSVINANVALLTTLTPQSQVKIVGESNCIKQMVSSAFKSVKESWNTKFGGFAQAYFLDGFGCKKYYEDMVCSTWGNYPKRYEILDSDARVYYTDNASLYDAFLSKYYILEVLETFANDKQKISEELEINKHLCDALCHQYSFYLKFKSNDLRAQSIYNGALKNSNGDFGLKLLLDKEEDIMAKLVDNYKSYHLKQYDIGAYDYTGSDTVRC